MKLDDLLIFVFGLASLLFLVRFLLQASGADFYNPISQAVVNATDPVCKPMRIALRPYRKFDFASFLVAWLIGIAGVVVGGLIDNSLEPVLAIVSRGLFWTLFVLTNFYLWSLIIIVIASFVAQGGYHPALALLHQLLNPVIAPVRRVLPSLGPLDLSPMVILLLIFFIQGFLRPLAYG